MSAIRFGDPLPAFAVVETPAYAGGGNRARCPQPHFDAEGGPVDGPAAFRYVTGAGVVVACRAHAPDEARRALIDAGQLDRPPAPPRGLWS